MEFLVESLVTTKNLKFNKNKSIGEVLVIVEGESDEYTLLKHIFKEVLDFTYVPVKRNKIIKDIYQSKANKYARIIVANTSNSNISSLVTDLDFKDRLYAIMSKEYGKSLKNIPVYILWDRDFESNTNNKLITNLLNIYHSAYDNGTDMNGLLLISYPCLEVYVISNFDKKMWKLEFANSKSVKSYKKHERYNVSDINEKTLKLALVNMHYIFKDFQIYDYDSSNFENVNLKIFGKQEEYFKHYKSYKALSLISIMLVDLGIIYLDK